MKLTICSFEIAKQLTKIGFTQKYNALNGDKYYNHLGIEGGDCAEMIKHRKSKSNEYDIILAPTLALVQMWLREKYNLFVEPKTYTADYFSFCIYKLDKVVHILAVTGRMVDDGASESKSFDTYDQALEAGILEAIKLINYEQ